MTDIATDPWAGLRGLTHARIGLSRTGDTIGGRDVRALQAAHAQAQRAVHAELDVGSLGLESIVVSSAAPDRASFVRRPDWGRRLADDTVLPHTPCDVVFVIADGLSALAAIRQGPRVLDAVRGLLPDWRIGPVVAAHRARVALGDEIATIMGAGCVVMMIGERPGLSVADSLSLYVTWKPRVGRMDSERNCISNIHDKGGLSPVAAAHRLAWLLRAARDLDASGVMLKDESDRMEILPP